MKPFLHIRTTIRKINKKVSSKWIFTITVALETKNCERFFQRIETLNHNVIDWPDRLEKESMYENKNIEKFSLQLNLDKIIYALCIVIATLSPNSQVLGH
jgi:hypothetical protein